MMLAILKNPIISAILAMLFYGTWAAFSNFDYGYSSSKNAFVIQGSFAFFSTLLSGHLALYLIQKLKGMPQHLLLSYLIIVILLFTVPFILHSIFLTPNKLMSMAPGMIMGSAYIGIFLHLHSKT